VIRAETLLFPGGALRTVLLVAALLSMLVGVLGAMVQVDLKRLLSFTLVSHIGYMIFGVGLGSVPALSATVFYVLHHITIQTALFLVSGLIERRGGSASMRRLGGLARTAPLIGLLFFVPAMNLGGIPPMSGFLGKLGLLDAGVRDGGPLALVLVAAAVLTSLLTLYALVRVWNQVFWRAPAVPEPEEPDGSDEDSAEDEDEDEVRPDVRLPAAMVGATLAMVALSLAYTAGGGPLVGLTDRTAAELAAPHGYAGAVAPEGPP
jgi:multicomponent Na+:H+ antiporter subunit D